MSSDPSDGRGGRGGPGGSAAGGSSSSNASPSISRDSQDYNTPVSMTTLSVPRASVNTTIGSVDSRAERRCSSPSPTAVSAVSTGNTSSGGNGGNGVAGERGRLFSTSPTSSPSPSPSPTPADGSGDLSTSSAQQQQQLQQQQQHMVLSPALMSSISSSSSSSSSLTGTGSSFSAARSSTTSSSMMTYPGEEDGQRSATRVEPGAANVNSSSHSTSASGSGSGGNSSNSSSTNSSNNNKSNNTVNSNSSSSGGGGAAIATPNPPSPPHITTGFPVLNASFSVSPSSPSVSPTGLNANPRRSLNAAFTISPRTESDMEASEEYNSDAPSVCLELDKLDPPTKQYCNLGSLEERRTFVTQGCVAAAKAMSTQRIIDHLLPAILTAFEADDYSESFDDCAPSITRALPQVIACMEPKSTANLSYFMGLIMELCCSAEQVVVQETVASLQTIMGMVDDDVILDLFLPFVLAMRVSFWSAPRMVAASLLGHIAVRPAVLQASGLTVTDMFNYYAESGSDASAMVRAGVVTSLHDWVRVASVHHLTLAEMPLPLLRSLATDDLSDTVRYLLIEEIEKLARLIGRKSTSKYLLSTYVSAFVDPSWRVRFTAASLLGTMASLVLNADDLEVVVKTLAADEEPETRAAVARQLDAVVQHCSPAMIQHCCALVVEHFAEDENPVVRRSAARHCHCFVYGSDEVVQTMCTFLVKLMEDTSFVVQESAIQSLGDLITSLDKSVRAAEQQAELSASVSSSSSTGATTNNSNSNSNNNNSAHATGAGLSLSTTSTSSTSKQKPQPSRIPSPPQQPVHSHRNSGRHHEPFRTSRLTSATASANGNQASVAEVNVARVKKRADSIASAFVDKLTLLSGSRNWRIRDVVVCVTQYFPLVLPPEEFRPLTSIICGALHDPVSAVRTQAVHTLERVAASYGGTWAAQTATELLHSDTLSPARAVSYMWRVMMIQCLEVLLPVVSELSAKDAQRQQLLAMTVALLQQYTVDRVPNVRIATALALPKWFTWFDVTDTERHAYNEAIHTLQQDTDIDVLDASQHIPYNRRVEGEKEI
ncbi:protein phosphatase 2A regulatory subunit [Lotmaria passim]